jgi:hypothetical protein
MLKEYWKFSLGLVVVISLIAYADVLGNRIKDADLKHQQAVVLTEQQAQDINVLQNKLAMSKQNAELLVGVIEKAQGGKVQPINHFIIQAPNIQQATEDVASKINTRDPTLPPAALEKTDHTIVVQNTNKTPAANYDVGVFKVNNYKNWEWSTGYGQHGGDQYIPVALQRNFSKDDAVSAEYHVGGHEKGFEVKYIWKTDKLFWLF